MASRFSLRASATALLLLAACANKAPVHPAAYVVIVGASDRYAGEIAAWIRERLVFPKDAWVQGQSGTVGILIRLGQTGAVKDTRLLRSSRSRSLDAEALELFSKASLPPDPSSKIEGDLLLTIEVHFRRQSGPAPRR